MMKEVGRKISENRKKQRKKEVFKTSFLQLQLLSEIFVRN